MFRQESKVVDYHLNDDKKFLVPIDNFDSQEFNLNDAGWIRNDISQLARAQTQAEYDSIMRRLVELKSQGTIPEGQSLRESFDLIKPRYCQSPNEIEQYVQMTQQYSNSVSSTEDVSSQKEPVKQVVAPSSDEALVSE